MRRHGAWIHTAYEQLGFHEAACTAVAHAVHSSVKQQAACTLVSQNAGGCLRRRVHVSCSACAVCCHMPMLTCLLFDTCVCAGDKPELLYPEAAAELSAMGYSSTLEYVAAAAEAVLQQTGLIPHINAGVMDQEQLLRCV